MRAVKAIVVLLALATLGVSAWWYLYVYRPGAQEVRYRTAPVEKGELLVTIQSTGTVEPEDVVDVGAQVAGQILEFGKDQKGKPVDYCTQVQKDMVLARIDDTTYKASRAVAQAQLDQAVAGVARAKADLVQMQAKLVQAENDWRRAQKLGPSEALSQSAVDSYQAGYEVAKANLEVGKASQVVAEATVAQARATLDRAERDLGYCTIKSPVDGVIIDRRVNIGQTVVASLSAPSLFLIARDLRRMEVWVAVNEADIASIKIGQPVTFTVDTFPGETFKGEVGTVRWNASMTQNVVTYTVEIATDNSSNRLLPYLTANVLFEVSRKPDVLQVPNAALRWSPPPERVAPNARDQVATSRPRRGAGRPTSRPADGGAENRGTVWVQDGKFVRPVAVRLGGTDGFMREVRGKDLLEGMEVIVGEITAQQSAAAPAAGASPFTPQLPQRRRNGR